MGTFHDGWARFQTRNLSNPAALQNSAISFISLCDISSFHSFYFVTQQNRTLEFVLCGSDSYLCPFSPQKWNCHQIEQIVALWGTMYFVILGCKSSKLTYFHMTAMTKPFNRVAVYLQHLLSCQCVTSFCLHPSLPLLLLLFLPPTITLSFPTLYFRDGGVLLSSPCRMVQASLSLIHLHFFFFLPPCVCLSTLLEPAAKQTLPVPSIPAGGWKSSLPEIAQIIALQRYFLLPSLFLSAAPPRPRLFFSLSKLFCALLFLENLSDSFFLRRKKRKSLLIFFFFLPKGQKSSNHFWSVGFPEMLIGPIDIRGEKKQSTQHFWGQMLLLPPGNWGGARERMEKKEEIFAVLFFQPVRAGVMRKCSVLVFKTLQKSKNWGRPAQVTPPTAAKGDTGGCRTMHFV